MKNKFPRRLTAFVLSLILAAAAALPSLAVYPIPTQTANSAESIYMFDLDTGKPILSQNASQQRYIASLTKMMTALLYIESGKDMNEEITVPDSLTQEFRDIRNANGSTIKLQIGERIRRIDLLYCLLVASANDAASVIAYDVAGDLTSFVAQMNARAQELGCTATNFTCPHGLYDYGNVSTAEDLAKIASACYANETYMQVANTEAYTLPATNMRESEREIKTTNLPLHTDYEYYRDYIRGMKTGFTTLAGRCYVTFAEQNGHTYGLVVLGSDLDNVYRESVEMLDWVFASFSDRLLFTADTPLVSVPLTKCRTESAVELYPANDVYGYGHADDAVTFEFDIPESVAATVKEGQFIGNARVYLDGYYVGEVALVSHREYVSDFVTDMKNSFFLLGSLLPILALISFVTLVSGGGSLNLGKKLKKKQR